MSYAILRPAVLLGKEWPIFPLPPRLAYWATRVIGWYVGDVFLTWEELKGLMAGTLEVDTPPTGTTRLTIWANKHADSLGIKYANKLARRKDREKAYG